MTNLTDMVDLKSGKFTWGVLVKIHHIANFQIVEYDNEDDFITMFHPFIDETDIGQVYESLKQAIVAAIVFECNTSEGINSHDCIVVVGLIFRMIKGID